MNPKTGTRVLFKPNNVSLLFVVVLNERLIFVYLIFKGFLFKFALCFVQTCPGDNDTISLKIATCL